jgi:hypothetical protein
MAIRVLALALSLIVAARATAKPPDLPQSTTVDCKAVTPVVDVDFIPLLEPISAQGCAEGEECELRRDADRHAACHRMSNCWLFSVCPLFAWKDCLSVWLSSGPFGVELPCEEKQPEQLSDPPCEVKQPEQLSDPPHEVTTCPYLKAKQERATRKKASKAEIMHKVRGYLKAARMFEEFGFYSDACDCYTEISRLAPRSRWARLAESRMEALCAAEYPVYATESAEESESPQSALPAEPTQVFGAYDISDLVKASADSKKPSTKDEAKLAEELIFFMQQHLKPDSWKGQGGTGVAEYRAETNSLVIQHDPATQEQVASFLENVRYMRKFGGAPAAWLRLLNEKNRGGEEPSSEPAEPKAEPPMALMGLDIRELLTSYEVEWDRSTDALKVMAKYDPEGMSSELIRLIENGVSPNSWISHGGSGRIDFNPELTTLFVTNTSTVLEDVAALIQSRRHELQLRKERCEQEVKASELKRQVRWGRPCPEKALSCVSDWLRDSVCFDAQKTLVDALLQESQAALEKGQRQRAEALATCALLMDREAVMQHPLVYKMHLLTQVFPESPQVQMHPRMPAVDPAVVHAYTEILDVLPAGKVAVQVIRKTKPEVKPAVLEVKEEECELEVVSETKKENSSCCCDLDVSNGRLRFQVQMGSWTFKLVDEGKDRSFSMSLRCFGSKD